MAIQDGTEANALDKLIGRAFGNNPEAAEVVRRLATAKTERERQVASLMANVATTGALRTDWVPEGSIVELCLGTWERLTDDESAVTAEKWEGYVALRALSSGIFKVQGVEYSHGCYSPNSGRLLRPDDAVQLFSRTVVAGKPNFEGLLYALERVYAKNGRNVVDVGNDKPKPGLHLVLAEVNIDETQVLPVPKASD